MMKRQCWDLFRMFTIFCLIGVGLVCSTHLMSYSLPLTPLFCVYVQLNVTRKFNLLILVHREVQINNWLHAVIACECAMRWMLFSRNKKNQIERERDQGVVMQLGKVLYDLRSWLLLFLLAVLFYFQQTFHKYWTKEAIAVLVVVNKKKNHQGDGKEFSIKKSMKIKVFLIIFHPFWLFNCLLPNFRLFLIHSNYLA